MQQDAAYQDDVTPDFQAAPSGDGTGQGTPRNDGRGSKLPLGCLILAGIAIVVCPVAVFASLFTSGASSTPQPTLDYAAMGTAAFGSALAANLSTLQARTPTARATLTLAPLPTATETAVLASFAGVAGAACIPNHPAEAARVVDVVDGDTIKVVLEQDGKTYSLRYIGMDTAEMNPPGQYFAAEASGRNAQLTYGKTVMLVKDVSETDRYGRLLRYVIVDNVFVNFELVAGGYAHSASYPPDTACIPIFRAAEQQASAAQVGLWGTPPTLVPFPSSASLGIVPPPPATNLPDGRSESCDSSYPDICLQDGIGDYDCAGGSGNGPNYVSGPFRVLPPDPFKLPYDKDGIGCE
jgi:micrococcal nuclease